MKKYLLIIFTMISSISAISQNKINVVIPETYELSNIILALTEYGRYDEFEVLKTTEYYQDVMQFFDPVKKHPLLDSVNYSREKWEDYLSFRTDAFAFQFDENDKLKRNINFYSVNGHKPFDTHLDLINDFVEKSNFRRFYNEHKSYYNFLTNNYSKYYFIDKAVSFLDNFVGLQHSESSDFKYYIVLSPLVNRMNCHRDITKNIIADFPSATPEFLSQNISEKNLPARLNGNHMIFTELDHGYINSNSEKHKQLISKNFNSQKWNNNSGYQGIDVFNEYMTWAVWDIFVKQNFPEIADSIILQWQIQNASRGFFAANIFSDKIFNILQSNKYENFQSIYVPLLEWCKSMETKLTVPIIINFSYQKNVDNTLNIQLIFSESMSSSEAFEVILSEIQNGSEIGNNKKVMINNAIWTDNCKKVSFNLQLELKEFVMVFNWWGITKPVISQNNIFLQFKSHIVIKDEFTKAIPQKNKSNYIFIVISAIIGCIIAVGVYLFFKK